MLDDSSVIFIFTVYTKASFRTKTLRNVDPPSLEKLNFFFYFSMAETERSINLPQDVNFLVFSH